MELKELREPFPRERISWRAQQVSVKQDGSASALALAYVDARDVTDRLDEVCGPENWQSRYSFSPDGKKTICEIGVRCGDEWIWKADGAGDSDIEAEKGALSDAFKRAAVKWGIARYLYDLKSPWVPCELGYGNKWKKFTVDPWDIVDRGYQNARAPRGENTSQSRQDDRQQRSGSSTGTRQPSGTSASSAPSGGISLQCEVCKRNLTEKIASFCKSKGMPPLCMDHQKTWSPSSGASETMDNDMTGGTYEDYDDPFQDE